MPVSHGKCHFPKAWSATSNWQLKLSPDSTPFEDAAFVSRLQKLLSLLASEQPGEADVARRKLLEHLGHHRLSLTDVGVRLRQPPAAVPRLSSSFGGAEMGMERQLYLARVARQEADGEVQRARLRVAELSRSLQEANIDAARAMQSQARARVLALFGWALALLSGGYLLSQFLHPFTMPETAARNASATTQAMLRPVDPDAGGQTLRPAVGERFGTVLVQDLPVRLTASEDGGVRAFLNRGMRVIIERQVRASDQTWLLIRSVTGTGWVRGGDVLH